MPLIPVNKFNSRHVTSIFSKHLKFFNEIGFSIERKQKRKEKLKTNFNTNVLTIPNQSSILYSIWKQSGLTQKGFKTIYG